MSSLMSVLRVELTPEEQELIKRYKAETHPLTFITNREGNKIPKDTVSSPMRSVPEEMKNSTILLNNEEVVKDACMRFNTLLDVIATFGGEQVIEF